MENSQSPICLVCTRQHMGMKNDKEILINQMNKSYEATHEHRQNISTTVYYAVLIKSNRPVPASMQLAKHKHTRTVYEILTDVLKQPYKMVQKTGPLPTMTQKCHYILAFNFTKQ